MRQLLLILFVLFQIKGYSQTSLSQDKSKLIRSIKPDFYIKGGDYEIKNLLEAQIVHSYGGKVMKGPNYFKPELNKLLK